MSRVVAARFDTFSAADSAAHALFAARHSEDAVAIFYADPKRGQRAATVVHDPDLSPDSWSVRYGAQASVAGLSMAGAILGAGLVLSFHGPDLLMMAAAAAGACVGSWVGALWLSGWGRARISRSGSPLASVILTIQVRAQDESAVAEILHDAGGRSVERVRGRWRHGQWTDADGASPLQHSSVGDRMVMH